MTTAHEVGRLAGVSASTVSRALAGSPRISEVTRQRVAAAAAQLGYSPNPVAQGLRLGRSRTLGLLVPDLENPFFATVTKAVQARAAAAGYSVVIADSDEDPAAEIDLVGVLSRRADGLVLASPRAGDDEIAAATAGIPTVVVNRCVPGLPWAVSDDASGAAQVLGHLVALGHERIAVAGGPATSWTGGRRVRGLRTGAEALGTSLVELGAFAPQHSGGVAAADHAVASGATAVVAFNDLQALGILSRLRERGLRVPADMSVVGFDDVSAATLVSPALTTVHVLRHRLGRRAVDVLVALLEGTPATAGPVGVELPADLVVRASTGVAPDAPRPSRPTDGTLGLPADPALVGVRP